ncbi:MAG: NAD(P)-dependent oxidoreductase [Brevundimonas sp.]|uniref:NAD-dependent epimerase/dehydratase family protein n=1 Tax=Brevundimonas sp. TaxID=1871086 RepID=UPI002AB9650D|nr:NAD(P)-dependent oxidoreductase [Brevundimonas sp.]MDZ4113562.1 NAD(P)-dependent oxidoreductase [Brevundimonas sp.]
MIMITGSRGLIGSATAKRLTAAGHTVRTFDIADDPSQDSRRPGVWSEVLDGVDGVIHLAAVSRVVWAESDPDRTQATNVDALEGLLAAAAATPRPPWVVFASSREVYGEPTILPVAESAPLAPLNVYARSKVAGETMVLAAAAQGLVANIARFSNVYGCIHDHHDRVVPAFARATATGGVMRIEGADHMFDFTHIEDVSRGLHLLVDATARGDRLDPIHFVTGRGTTLAQLADIALQVGDGRVTKQLAPPRSYDVARFTGDPRQARDTLGWTAQIGIEEGFAGLVEAFSLAGLQCAEAPTVQRAAHG